MFKNIDIPNNIKIRFAIVTILLAVSFFFIRHYRIFQPAAIVLAPNGGEMFEYGQAVQVRWTPGTPGIRLIEFVPVSGGSSLAAYNAAPFSYTVADTSGSRSFNLSERIPAGSYYVRIYTANSYEFDQSDGSIQIIEKEFSKAKADIAPPPAVSAPTPSAPAPSMPTPSQIPSTPPLPSSSTPCAELWSCGGWTSCVNSAQTIICTDANNCGTTNARPALSRSCTSPSPKTIPTREAVPAQKQLEQLPPLEQLPTSVQEKVAQEKITPPVQKPVEHKSLMARTWSRVINVFKSFFGI